MTSGVDKYFSLIALFIVFRETIEASLIVSVLLQFLSRSFPHLKKQVWWGVSMGIFISIIFGVIFSLVFYLAKENLFNGQNKAIFKGSIAWFAGILITILAFAMLRYKGWETKIKRKLEGMAQQELEKNNSTDTEELPTTKFGKFKASTKRGLAVVTRPISKASLAFYNGTNHACGAFWGACGRCFHKPDADFQPKSELVNAGDLELQIAATQSHGWGIFLIVFTTVMREGIESVVFLAGVGNAEPSSLPLPGLVGLICGIAAGFFLYYSGKQVKDIKYFIIFMSIVLFFIAGGQFMVGADYLITGGMFGYASPWTNKRPWYMQPLWDLSTCCSDQDTGDKKIYKFFALARAIFGYQDKPTMIEITIYGGYWFLVLLAAVYKWHTGSLFDADYKYKRQMKKEAAKQAATANTETTSSEGRSSELEDIKYEDYDELDRIAKLPGIVSPEVGHLHRITEKSYYGDSEYAGPVAASTIGGDMSPRQSNNGSAPQTAVSAPKQQVARH